MKKAIYISVATVAVILIVAGHQACKKGDNALGFLSPSGSLKTTVEQLNLKDRFGNNIFDDITYDPDSNLMVIIDRGDKVEFMGRDEKNTLKQYAQLGLYFVSKYNRNLIPNIQRACPTVLYRINNGEADVVEVELLKDDYNACEKMHMTDDSITCRRIGLKLDLVSKPFAIGNNEVSYLEELGVDLQCTKTEVVGKDIIFYVHINGWPGALSGIVAKITDWTKKLIIKYLVDTESRQKDLKVIKDYGLNVVIRFYGFDSSDYSEMVIKPTDWGGEQPAQAEADSEAASSDTSSVLHPQIPAAEN
ncbi:MAG: hypothetical protein J5523_03740 [Muribaculaceae bacterium]|nr:hypothetical protein [Muribaculaceae bacterium]